MLDLIPPTPDAAILEMMSWWAAGGAALGFCAILVRWLTKRVMRNEPVAVTLHIPGAPKEIDRAPVPWGPSGLFATVLGAAVGAVWAWGWYGPNEVQERIGVIFAAIGILQAVWRLLRVTRDAPAVGEAPHEDPDGTAAGRLPGAWGGIALACFGALIAIV